MRQVPTQPYAIIGNGRIATHFCHYLTLLSLPYRQWSRQAAPNASQLTEIITTCNPVLILINDKAIDEFINTLRTSDQIQQKTFVHFSGQLVSKLAYGAHPLMTFGTELYSLEKYQQIPFVLESNLKTFAELLPGLENPHFTIPAEQKAFYHSLCVLSGNFTVLLWQKFFTELEQTLNIPKQFAYPYLQQILFNLQQNSQSALTGPLIRNDQTTIDANLAALDQDPFQEVYQAFVNAYQKN